jgi:hypothetical protein
VNPNSTTALTQAYLAYDEQDLDEDRRDLDRFGPR